MSFRLPASRKPLVSYRNAAAVVTIALLAVVVPSASAHKAPRKHPRLHAIAHAFADVALPGIGLFPDEDDVPPSDGKQYELKLSHSHTGEMIDVVYRIGDTYVPQALNQLNQFLRDNHNEEVSNYDPRTFDVLHTMLAKLGKGQSVIDVLSGYRSQETNDELRASGTTNAAEHSQHIEAAAVDLRVPGVPAPVLRDAAKSLEAGGVGYYPASQFVHVDVGPVREWTYSPHRGKAHHGHSRAHARRSRHS